MDYSYTLAFFRLSPRLSRTSATLKKAYKEEEKKKQQGEKMKEKEKNDKIPTAEC